MTESEILELAKQSGLDVAMSDREHNLTIDDWTNELITFATAIAQRTRVELGECRKDAANEIERLQKIEAAAKNLMHYNLVGAPDWAEWDRYFDELNKVLKRG